MPIDAGDLRGGANRLVRATNAEQRRLARVYDRWAAGLQREILSALAHLAQPQQLEAILNRHLPDLEAKLISITHDGVKAAEKLAIGRDKPSPRVLAARNRHLSAADEKITSALMPFVAERLKAALVGPFLEAGDVAKALKAQRAYPTQYAGNFWSMIFEAKRAKGQDGDDALRRQGQPPARVRWVLDPQAEHCQASPGFYGCPDLAGEYESWDALPTVPGGQVTCRLNDRCWIEVWRNGRWER